MDPVLRAATVRVRAHLLGRLPPSDLETDGLVRTSLAHAMFKYLVVRPPHVNARPLDAAKLVRLVEWIEAHLGEPLTNEALAGVAAMSPYHFMRRHPESSRAAVAQAVDHAGNGHRFREVLARWGTA